MITTLETNSVPARPDQGNGGKRQSGGLEGWAPESLTVTLESEVLSKFTGAKVLSLPLEKTLALGTRSVT